MASARKLGSIGPDFCGFDGSDGLAVGTLDCHRCCRALHAGANDDDDDDDDDDNDVDVGDGDDDRQQRWW